MSSSPISKRSAPRSPEPEAPRRPARGSRSKLPVAGGGPLPGGGGCAGRARDDGHRRGRGRGRGRRRDGGVRRPCRWAPGQLPPPVFGRALSIASALRLLPRRAAIGRALRHRLRVSATAFSRPGWPGERAPAGGCKGEAEWRGWWLRRLEQVTADRDQQGDCEECGQGPSSGSPVDPQATHIRHNPASGNGAPL